MPDQNLPPPGSAQNTDFPGAAAPSSRPGVRPAATPSASTPDQNERPDDIITARSKANGANYQFTRDLWDRLTRQQQDGFDVVNAQSFAAAQLGPPVPAAAPAPPVNDPSRSIGGFWAQVIRNQQKMLGRSLKSDDFSNLPPEYQVALGRVKQIRPPGQADSGLGGLDPSRPQTIVEYENGVKLIVNAPAEKLQPNGDGVSGDDIVGFDYTRPTGKTNTEIEAEIRQAEAAARLSNAQAARLEELNKGNLPTQEAQANIDKAKADLAKTSADTDAVRRALAAGRPEAEVQQILAGTAATTSQAQSASENAATNRGRLVLDATLAEIDRRYKEGTIDNETRRILQNSAWNRWQADNTNTQTVLAAAGKGLEAELTQRNQNIALDNTRVNAASSGFSDDARTATTMAQYIDPSIAENVLYNGLLGLSGLRKATVKDWGGLQTYAPVTVPGIIQQLGYNTPINLRSLDSDDEIEQRVDDIRNGRQVRDTMTQPVGPAPLQTPTPVPTYTVPKPAVVPTTPAPAPVRPSALPPEPANPAMPVPVVEPTFRGDGSVSMAPPQQPAPYSPSPSLTQSNTILASTLGQPIRYAQGGTPIAVKDLFGQVRPVVSRRYGWLG